MKKLKLNPERVDVRLDGLLRAPGEYVYQKSIVRGDAKEKVIGLASIVAKVTRDHHMVRLAKMYPEYRFEIHKGYGTLAHRKAIKKLGLSPVHRKNFCSRIVGRK
jgi:ribonuclease HII